MNTVIRITLAAIALGASATHASPWLATDAEGVSYPPSTASTAYSGQFDRPIGFDMLSSSDGTVSHEAIFGKVQPTLAARPSPYVGTSDRMFSWNDVPNPDIHPGGF